MIKTVLKEVIIILLLCVAIVLILGILFYDYNPINKVIPNKVAYTVPENIRNELEEENLKSSISIESKVYTVEGSDLNIYKKSKAYNPSKENPFAYISTNTTDSGTPTGSSVDTSAKSNNSSNSNAKTANNGSTSNQKNGLK